MLLQKVFYAAALVLPLAVASTPASAGSDVNVRFGVGIGTPYYGYRDDRYYDDDFYPYQRRKLSCWQARELVRDRGYRKVATIECNGRVYTFRAIRGNRAIRLQVNSRTGAVWRS
ncbi:MAG TPA: hypothetical protein VET25_04575 [Aestuariivirgaceae bacterium]|nr:hypothetical protein [Aestuariivirgaceae bacterium]